MFTTRAERTCQIALVHVNATGSVGPGAYNIRKNYLDSCKPNYVGFASTRDRGLTSVSGGEKYATEIPGPGEYFQTSYVGKADSTGSSFRSKTSRLEETCSSSNDDNNLRTNIPQHHDDFHIYASKSQLVRTEAKKQKEQTVMIQRVTKKRPDIHSNFPPNKKDKSPLVSLCSPAFQYDWKTESSDSWKNISSRPAHLPTSSPPPTSSTHSGVNTSSNSRCDSWISKSDTPGPSSYNPVAPSWEKGSTVPFKSRVKMIHQQGLSNEKECTKVPNNQNSNKLNPTLQKNSREGYLLPSEKNSQPTKIQKLPQPMRDMNSTNFNSKQNQGCNIVQCFGSTSRRDTNPRLHPDLIPFPCKREEEQSRKVGPGSYFYDSKTNISENR